MLSVRTLHSLSQFLSLQTQNFLGVLLNKYGMDGRSVKITSTVLDDLCDVINDATEEQLHGLLSEIANTQGDLRSRIIPKYRYDERFDDLIKCLLIDGYTIEDNKFKTIDSSVVGVTSLNDELIEELTTSGLPASVDVIKKLDESTQSFLSPTANFNHCLNDARIALETLASSIASKIASTQSVGCTETRWGGVIAFLRKSEFITVEQERGLVGVYGFVSPGSHRPLGLSEQEYARLGRNFIFGVCWFLVKQFKYSSNS